MKIKALIALLLLTALLLCGCGKEKENSTPEVSAPVTVDTSYAIYHAQNADVNVQQAALCFQTAFQQRAKLTLNIVKEKPADKYMEVAVNSSLAEGTYTIKALGTKIVLEASDSYTLVCAAREIREKWAATEGAFGKATVSLTPEMCQTLSGSYNKANMPFVIMSQNILFKENPSPNSIAERSERLKKLLQEYQPDIVGWQEFGNWNAYYHLFMSETYGITDDSNGVPIMYRKDRYTLVDTGKFYLSSTPEVPSKVEGSSGNRAGSWAFLKDKLTDKQILVVSTHPCWTTDEVREKEVTNLLNYLKDKINANITFITGDFNSTPESEPYNRVIEFGLKDSYHTAAKNLSSIDYTCGFFTTFDPSRIDYCFHDDNSTALEYKILNEMYGGFVSDHFGIVAKFEFNN